jgi:hypothetical protein
MDALDWVQIIIQARTFLDAKTLFSVRCVSKKTRNFFSWPVVRQLLHLSVWELPIPLTGADPRWIWFFLDVWSLSFLQKQLHETPIKKAVNRVAQGALRSVSYDGSFGDGILTGFVIPSMKSKKSQRIVNNEKKTVERPYEVTWCFKNGIPQQPQCECPVG